METILRGLIEHKIDTEIQLENLQILAETFRSFPIKSVEDCLFGHIIGSVSEFYLTFSKSNRRQLTEDEMEEFWEIIERRTMEIKGKIKLALSK